MVLMWFKEYRITTKKIKKIAKIIMNIPYKTERETKTPLFSLNLRKNKVTTIHTLEDKQNKQFFYEFPENKNKYKWRKKVLHF